MNSTFKEGQKFFRLTAEKFFDKLSSGNHRWEFRCECGKSRIANASQVRAGQIKQCLDCATESNKILMQRNAVKTAEARKLAFGEAARNSVLNGYKNNAKQRNLEFTISKYKFFHLIVQPCAYCTRSLNNIARSRNNTGDYRYTGLDIIRNSEGYTEDNCMSCCSVCNRAKDTMTFEEFRAWVTLVNKTIKSL